MGITIGGPTAWKVIAHRDIGIAFHWINGEPAMVLFPRHRALMIRKAVPYALPLESLHELVLPDTKGEGVNTGALLEKARTAAHYMGLGDEWGTVHNVADAIMAGIVDLVNMPPEPKWHADQSKARVGEIEIKGDGKTLFEGEA